MTATTQQAGTAVCVPAGSAIDLRLPPYPGGWAPLTIVPTGPAVTSRSSSPDGSAEIEISTSEPGTYTLTTHTLDTLAATYTWTLTAAVK